MIKINPYLNFTGRTEEAFNFYKSIFGGEFAMLQRFKEVQDLPNKEKLSPSDLEKIMHIALPLGDNTLMATDVLESMGQKIITGENVSLSLSVDSKEEADRIFNALLEKGKVAMPMEEMFWGAYFGMIDDEFGIKWMISFDKMRQEK